MCGRGGGEDGTVPTPHFDQRLAVVVAGGGSDEEGTRDSSQGTISWQTRTNLLQPLPMKIRYAFQSIFVIINLWDVFQSICLK